MDFFFAMVLDLLRGLCSRVIGGDRGLELTRLA